MICYCLSWKLLNSAYHCSHALVCRKHSGLMFNKAPRSQNIKILHEKIWKWCIILIWCLLLFWRGFWYTRMAPKVTRAILLCWPTTSEADVGGMAVRVEPSHQYSVKFCCRVTDGSRGAVWPNGIWHGCAEEAKVCHWIPPQGENCTHWHSLTLAAHLWRPNSGCEQWGLLQQWQQWQWSPRLVQVLMSTGFVRCFVGFVHCWQKCRANSGDCWKAVFL